MPYKRKYVPKNRRNKKVLKRGTYPRQKFKFSKGLSRSVIPFTRERETYFKLNDLTGTGTQPFDQIVHTADGGAVGQIRVSLDDFPNHTDFTNLFRQYKINYLKLIFYPSANVVPAGSTRDEGGSYSNNQVLIRTMLNRTGIAMGAGNTISEWSQIQAKKQWMLATDKPTTITCKLSQLSQVFDSTGGTEPCVIKPKYVSTNHPDIFHYGLNVRFDSLNGTALNQTDQIWPSFRIVAKAYFTCKGVA